MLPFSRTVEPLRSRTRPSGSDSARNEWDGHGEADSEAILVDPDRIMRSPSPVELYAPACVAYGSIYSTIEPTYDLQ
ncbi:hypothetical protein CY34DRAFT_19652 [Suillus luteus UH-Slu-Lm8-n1]|uniref:Uncharacterized protein n=1 Tax=Suillus luteus UH-Slu-Lm8-n1 TaxID=930992 RepID=A0A0D0ABR6_9AGAM|nr:hypothetical protein CY34DRAFT_19652 [Suillus luteus UH-Slu-Lm8-n1]